jgi:hypothetical protein
MLGVPRRDGELILVTDASDVGGGASLYQFQNLEKEQIPEECRVEGVNHDGTLKHSYPKTCHLVPLGHWNWK